MKINRAALKVLSLAAGITATITLSPSGASAQVVAPVIQCPGGYAYSSGYGCVPLSPGYAAVYGPPVAVERPPVYDTFGINLDLGGGHGGGRGHGHGHAHPNFHR